MTDQIIALPSRRSPGCSPTPADLAEGEHDVVEALAEMGAVALSLSQIMAHEAAEGADLEETYCYYPALMAAADEAESRSDGEQIIAEITAFLRTDPRASTLLSESAMAAAVAEWHPEVRAKAFLGHFAWLACKEESARRIAAAGRPGGST